MSKQTVWLVIIFVGLSFTFLGTSAGSTTSLNNLLGDVGLTVGVAPNPYNTLAEQLNNEQAQLNNESSSLAAREAALASSSEEASTVAAPSDQYLLAGIVVVALLVLINFYWDWRRARRENPQMPQT